MARDPVPSPPGELLERPDAVAETPVSVRLGEGVAELAASRGGVIYLRLRESRCCSGTLAFFDATTEPPAPGDTERAWRVGGVEVRLVSALRRPPTEIAIERRGRRGRLVALWDGCAYRL